MSDNISLNSISTEKAIINLNDSLDEIDKSFFDMNCVMSKIIELSKGEMPDAIIGKFSEFQGYFPTINENLKSYIQDFKNLTINFSDENQRISLDEVVVQKEGGELINVKNES